MSQSVFNNPADGALEAATAYVEAVLSLVGDADPIEILSALPDALETAVADLDADQRRQPEASGKWSAAEVVMHLLDSELVWAWRMRKALAEDRPRLEGYDQDRWARALGYRAADVDDALAVLRLLRRAHVRLLGGLDEAALARVVVHDERGEESVGHMMRLYAGHDLVHRRQLERIRATVLGG